MKIEIRKLIKKHFLNSSGHGLSNIARSETLFLKITWTIFWLAAVCGTAYLVSTGIIDYLKYEVNTKSRIVNDIPSNFPKITICNLDPFLTNDSMKFLSRVAEDLQYPYDPSLSDIEIANQMLSLDDAYFKATALYRAYLDPNRARFGYNRAQFIRKCEFGPENIKLLEISNCNFQSFYDRRFGNCFTFNAADNLKMFQSGKNNGLRLELFAGKSENFKSFSSIYGAKIFIYNHSTIYTDSEGIDVSIGKATNIALSKTFIQRLKYPYSECTIDSSTKADDIELRDTNVPTFINTNLKYRQMDCLNFCYQKRLIADCDCIDSNIQSFEQLSENQNVSYCLMDELYQECAMNLLQTGSYITSCRAECPLECESVSLSFETSFADFRTIFNYQNQLENDSIWYNQSYDSLIVSSSTSPETSLKVNIYFRDLSYHLITESASISKTTLFGSLGGMVGLLLGMSVLSFCEIFEFLVMFVSLICKRTKAKVVVPKKVHTKSKILTRLDRPNYQI